MSLISVVIPTYNSEKTIGLCLKSLKQQSCSDIEVVVVDNYSTDNTKEIAEVLGAKVIMCKAFRSKARNIGVSLTKGKFVILLDSDMALESKVVEECIKEAKKGFNAVIIPEISVGHGFWAGCRSLEKLCYIKDEKIEAARFFEKKVFYAVHGYDEFLEAGEDWDLHNRIRRKGFKISRSSSSIKHHEGNLRLSETFRKKHYYGKTLGAYLRKNPDIGKEQLHIIRPAFVRNWRKFVKDPTHGIGLLFLKGCEFTALCLGRFV